jgi:hypothetical protein
LETGKESPVIYRDIASWDTLFKYSMVRHNDISNIVGYATIRKMVPVSIGYCSNVDSSLTIRDSWRNSGIYEFSVWTAAGIEKADSILQKLLSG